MLFVLLQIGQVFYAGYISLFDWGLRGPKSFLGIENYQNVLSDPLFCKAVTNTLYYTVLVVPLQMVIGLFLAVIVNQKIRGQTFFRAAFYFPAIASSAAITVAVPVHLRAQRPVQRRARGARLQPVVRGARVRCHPRLVRRQRTALNTVIVLNAWTTSGTMMLFYLAFLQSIPNEIYEAAAIDGAGWWETFRRMTFPLLAPAHFFVATVSVIGALQLFDQAFIVGGTGGEPNNALTTIVLLLYRRRVAETDFGYAAAIGIVLFVIIFSVTLVQRRLFGGAPAW